MEKYFISVKRNPTIRERMHLNKLNDNERAEKAYLTES